MQKKNTPKPLAPDLIVRHSIYELDRSPMEGLTRDYVVLSLADAEADHPSLRRPHALLSIRDPWAPERGSAHESAFNVLGLVFTTTEGKPLYQKTVDENLKRFASAAEIVKPMSFHKLRHTVATHLAAQGTSLAIVKDQLGHSQIGITINTYGHAVPTALRAAADTLDGLFSEASNPN